MEVLMLKAMPEFGRRAKYEDFVHTTFQERGIRKPVNTMFNPEYAIPDRDADGVVHISRGSTYKEMVELYNGESKLMYSQCSASTSEDAKDVAYGELAMWCSAVTSKEIVLPYVESLSHQFDLTAIFDAVSTGNQNFDHEVFPYTRCGKPGFICNGRYKDHRVRRIFGLTPQIAKNKVAKVMLRYYQEDGNVVKCTMKKEWIHYEDCCVEETYQWFLNLKPKVPTIKGPFIDGYEYPIVISGSNAQYEIGADVDSHIYVLCEGETRASFKAAKQNVVPGYFFNSCVKVNERDRVYTIRVSTKGILYEAYVMILGIRTCEYLGIDVDKTLEFNVGCSNKFATRRLLKNTTKVKLKTKASSKIIPYMSVINNDLKLQYSWFERRCLFINRVDKIRLPDNLMKDKLTIWGLEYAHYGHLLNGENAESIVKCIFKLFGVNNTERNVEQYIKNYGMIQVDPSKSLILGDSGYIYLDVQANAIRAFNGIDGVFHEKVAYFNGDTYRVGNHGGVVIGLVKTNKVLELDRVDRFILFMCRCNYVMLTKLVKTYEKKFDNISRVDMYKHVARMVRNGYLSAHAERRAWITKVGSRGIDTGIDMGELSENDTETDESDSELKCRG